MQHIVSTNVPIHYLYDTLLLVHAMTCIIKLLSYNIYVNSNALLLLHIKPIARLHVENVPLLSI